MFYFEAWNEVRLRKMAWLRYEILQRIIQELLVDYYVKAQDKNLTSEDKKVRPENWGGVGYVDKNYGVGSRGRLWKELSAEM